MNPVPWTGIDLNRQEIARDATSVTEVFRHIYEAKAKVDHANYWCCKSTFNIFYTTELEEHVQPFYLYLYRDGRDVAASFKKAVVGPKHVYHIALEWLEEQEKSLLFLESIEESRKIMVSYEQLISQPEKTIRAICGKLGLEYVPQMLEYYDSQESNLTAESGKMWENVNKPFIRSNKGKFRDELSQDEIQIFEQIAGDMPQKLNYNSISKDSHISLDLKKFDQINKEMIKNVRENSKSDLKKRAAQEGLLNEIMDRLKVLS